MDTKDKSCPPTQLFVIQDSELATNKRCDGTINSSCQSEIPFKTSLFQSESQQIYLHFKLALYPMCRLRRTHYTNPQLYELWSISTLYYSIFICNILKYNPGSTSHAPCFRSVKDKTDVLFRFILLKAQHSTSTEPRERVPDQWYWMILVTLSVKSILNHGLNTHW